MDGVAGMVAVVRGLKDAGLAVTMYDNGKQFTLAPNSCFTPTTSKQTVPPVVRMHQAMDQIPQMANIQHLSNVPQMPGVPHAQVSHLPGASRYSQNMAPLRSTATDVGTDRLDVSRNSATQAIDGRYASVYQTTLCKMKPTSPPVLLTEFPPQRPDPDNMGNGNFVVGGTGSGDTRYTPVKAHNSYRGGLCWTERGQVCSPRPSRLPDAFASSLRKYPRLSPERSSEIVERLVTYTQGKNFGKSPTRYQQTRSMEYSECEDRTARSPSRLGRGFDSLRSRLNDDSPTRDGPRRYESGPLEYRKSPYSRSYDVRYVREMSKAARENVKMFPGNPYHQRRSSGVRERYDTDPEWRRTIPDQTSPSMVNSEIQASAVMVSKEVATVLKVEPPKRDVAVPANFVTKKAEEGAVPIYNQSVQTSPTRKAIQTNLSCTQIPSDNYIISVRKSMSDDQISKVELSNEFLEKLQETFRKHEYKHENHNNLNKVVHDAEAGGCRCRCRKIPVWYKDCDDSCRAFRRKVSKEIVNNRRYFSNRNIDVFRAEVTSFMSCNDQVRKVITTWLDGIPLKTHDFLGRLVKKEQILSYVVCRLRIIPHRLKLNKKRFRAEVLDIVDDIPFDVGHGNKNIYCNKLVEDLISKLESTQIRNHGNKCHQRKYYNKRFVINTAANLGKYTRPTNDTIRDFMRLQLIESIKNSQLDLDASKIGEIETGLVDIIIDYLDDIYSGRDEEVTDEIIALLRDTGQLLKNQATNFANLLLRNIKKTFAFKNINQNYYFGVNRYQKLHNCDTNKVDKNYGTCTMTLKSKICGTDFVTKENGEHSSEQGSNRNSDVDIKAKSENYKRRLKDVINKWLETIQFAVPDITDSSFRQIVVDNLATDIIDRHKYLGINPTAKMCENEMESIRYQIFKWISSLLGDNTAAILEKAPDLVHKIRGINVPVVTKRNKKRWGINVGTNPIAESVPQKPSVVLNYASRIVRAPALDKNISENQKIRSNEIGEYFTEFSQGSNGATFDVVRNPVRNASVLPKSAFAYTQTKSRSILAPFMMALQGNSGRISDTIAQPATILSTSPTLDELNKEYEIFVKEWVQQIPIAPQTPQDLAEEIRLGVFYGIFKAIAKIKSSPEILVNPFYYEDVLDDEIEELFSCIPTTEDFMSKKHLLKVRLIEKTSEINEKIKLTQAPETFAQKIVNQISVCVPRVETNLDDENIWKIYEDLRILFLAEEYILYIRYRDEDQIKANVYRLKLIKRMHEFVQGLKETYNKELKDINSDKFINDILTAMQQVPLPSDETIKQEADEILLGIEVEKWFSDLPLSTNNDPLEQLKRRTLRDKLAKKIYNMEKGMNFADESDDRALKHEVSLVLNKLPLRKDESMNINFMVDELLNRLKNRQRRGSLQRKSVMFNESIPPVSGQQIQSQQQYANPQMPTQKFSPFQSNIPVTNRPGNPWIPVQLPATLPPPTSVMQDPTGRTWYSFDQKRPSSAPHASAMYQKSPVDSLLSDLRPAGCYPSGMPGTSFPQEIHPGAPTQLIPPSVDSHLNGDPNFWLSRYLREHEAAHPPYLTADATLNFNPPHSSTIQDPLHIEAERPISSSLNQSQQPIQQSFGVSPQSPPRHSILHDQPNLVQAAQPRQTKVQQFYQDQSLRDQQSPQAPGPWPSMVEAENSIKPSAETAYASMDETRAPEAIWSQQPQIGSRPFMAQQGVTDPYHDPRRSHVEQTVVRPRQSLDGASQSMEQQGSPRQSLRQKEPRQNLANQNTAPGPETQYASIDETKAPAGFWGAKPEILIPSFYKPVDYTTTQGLSSETPANQGEDSLWISKYVQEYEATHPSVSTEPQNISIPYGPPQNARVMEPPEYKIFGREHPKSSTFYHPQTGPNISSGPCYSVPPSMLPKQEGSPQGPGCPGREFAYEQISNPGQKMPAEAPLYQSLPPGVRPLMQHRRHTIGPTEMQGQTQNPKVSISPGLVQVESPEIFQTPENATTQTEPFPRPIIDQAEGTPSPGSYASPTISQTGAIESVTSRQTAESVSPTSSAGSEALQQAPRYRYSAEVPTLTDPQPDFCVDVYTSLSSSKNTEDEEYYLANTTFRNEDPQKNIKSVQTAFSSIDLTKMKQNKDENSLRKTKSQEDIKTKPRSQMQDDIVEWLHEVYSMEKVKEWSKRLQRLAEKLKKPGCEEKLKAQIRRYLNRVPSCFSDNDEDSQEFREQLPDYIIDKLKKMFIKNDQPKTKPYDLYTIAVPKYYTPPNRDSELRNVIKNWIKNVPVKKKDFLCRPIRKEDILNTIILRLEPFIQNRPECTNDYKSMLRSYVVQIVREIPLNYDLLLVKGYIDSIVDDLVNVIIKLDKRNDGHYDIVPDLKTNELQENLQDRKGSDQILLNDVEDFVTENLMVHFEEANTSINNNRMTCIQVQIAGILLEALQIQSPGVYNENETKLDICDILRDVGRLSDYQAKHLSEEIVDKFNTYFFDKPNERKSTLVNSYSETCLVYNYPDNDPKHLPRRIFLEKHLNRNLSKYTRQITAQIEEWFDQVKDYLPMSHYLTFREMAISELAETVVSRQKYSEMHISSESIFEKTEHLKILIFKWVRKLAGEDKVEIIQHIPELLKKIRKVPIPPLNAHEAVKDYKSTSYERNHVSDAYIIKELYEDIFDWYFELPSDLKHYDDRKVKRHYIRKLAENIERGLSSNVYIDEVIDQEVDRWAKKVLRTMPKSLLIEELKTRIRLISLEVKNDTTDESHKVTAAPENMGTKTDFCTKVSNYLKEPHLNFRRKVTKQINEWLTDLPLPVYDKACKQAAVKNLAADIIHRQLFLEMNPYLKGTDEDELENLKYQIFKWLNKVVVSEDNMETVAHASQLMQRLQSITSKHHLQENWSANYLRNYTKRHASTSNNGYHNNYTSISKSVENLRTSSKKKSAGTSTIDLDSVPTIEFPTHFGSSKMEIPCYTNDAHLQSAKLDHSSKILSENYRSDHCRRLNFEKGFQKYKEYTSYPSAVSCNANLESFKPCKTQNQHSYDTKTEVYALSFFSKNKISDKLRNKHSKHTSNRRESRISGIPTGMTISQTHEYFDQIFKNRCEEIRLDEKNEQMALGESVRKQVYNEIWRTYFRLKSDPSIENDYTLFEAMFEDRLDLILDCLPHNKDMQSFRQSWKNKILLDVTRLLEYVHSITEYMSFKQVLFEKFYRQFIRLYIKGLPDRNQLFFIENTVKSYILYVRYKGTNSIKAHVYQQRLIKQFEQLAEDIKASYNIEFRHVNYNQLYQEAYKVLGNVSLPDEQTLKMLADEILISDEVEQWFRELPIKPMKDTLADLLRSRMKEILVKKLHEIEKRYGKDDKTITEEMMLETTQFLEKECISENKFNVIFYAHELIIRLKNRRQRQVENNAQVNDDSLVVGQTHSREGFVPLVISQPYTYPSTSKPSNLRASLISPNATPIYTLTCDQEHRNTNSFCQERKDLEPQHPCLWPKNGQIKEYRSVKHSDFVVTEDLHSKLSPINEDLQINRNYTNKSPIYDRSDVKARKSGTIIITSQAQSTCSIHAGSGHLQSSFASTPNIITDPNFFDCVYGEALYPSDGSKVLTSNPVSDSKSITSPDELSDDDEIRVRCRCMERVYKCCRKKKIIEEWDE